ncbi:hypothetical protein IQ06DRAFT_234587 [Phaeosphaeriaceae sp. SRC1lsM3a]|nr:hypothetical protein IQ06DRAFT_234587 [Stagonospora sp. SRC1lsM3a]
MPPVPPLYDSPFERSAPRRIFLKPSTSDIVTSPSHRRISSSSWLRFSNSPVATPSGQLKASLLCKGSGTSPSFNPPASEWVYLGAGQPIFFGKPEPQANWHEWKCRKYPQKTSRSPSPSSLSSEVVADKFTFQKQPVKRLSNESQLSNSIRMASPSDEGAATGAMKKHGLAGLTCEDLPSAFDSDDEEDE